MTILAIDPGCTESAYMHYSVSQSRPLRFAKVPNAELLSDLRQWNYDDVAIEMIASYGMSVGKEVFDTVFWIGRYYEVIRARVEPKLIYRLKVKQHLCHDSRAKDCHIRQALLDRFGPGRTAAIGTKKKPGPLYGVVKDCWSALAVAVVASDDTARPRVEMEVVGL